LKKNEIYNNTVKNPDQFFTTLLGSYYTVSIHLFSVQSACYQKKAQLKTQEKH